MAPGIRRYALLTLLIIFSISLLINVLFLFRYKPILDYTLKKLIEKETGGQYSLQFNSDQSQILLGKIILTGVDLVPIKAKMDSLENLGLIPCRSYTIHIQNLTLYLHNIFQFIWGKEIHLDLLELNNPDFLITIQKNHCNNFRDLQESSHHSERNSIKSLFISHFLTQGGKIRVHLKNQPDSSFVFKSSPITLNADSLFWNSSRQENVSPLKVLKNASFSMILQNVQWRSPNQAYRVVSKRVFYSNQDGIMEIQQCEGARDGFPGPLPANFNLLDQGVYFSLKYISLNKFNWPALLLGESFQVENIHIHTGNLAIIDHRIPKNARNYRPLPQAWLKKIPFPVFLNKIEFGEINLVYQERDSENHKSGSLRFLNAHGQIQNIHNRPLIPNSPDWLNLEFKSNFYGLGEARAHLRFNLNSNKEEFEMESHMEKQPLESINEMTIPLAGMRIISGNLGKMDLYLQGDSQETHGSVHALYKNLRIKFLISQKIKDPKKIKTLSRLANTFLILNDNPLLGEPERSSTFTFPRDPHRSFLNFIWKSLFTGLKPILGITPNRETSIYAFIQELQTYKSWDQSLVPERRKKREIRKERRILRRLQNHLGKGTLFPPPY